MNDQLPLFNPPPLTVSALTSYLRGLFLNDDMLQDLWVFGEISNVSQPASGHLYFTLKDASASLRCVMWRNVVRALKWLPKEGEAVEAHGSIDIYEAGGQYQLYADTIRPAGEGALYQEFLRLKNRLEAEGLFDPQRKKPIPPWPERIGIVTSPSGAAVRDILNTIRRRFPLAKAILSPTPVQGVEAPPAIIAALDALVRIAKPNVIIIARGGGSIEDLWAFNDERVGRAIANCPIPVVTGIGHETDFTIADFIADLRAPTPTAAAELVTPNKSDLSARLVELDQRLSRGFEAAISTRQNELQYLADRLQRLSPLSRIRSDRQRVDELTRRIQIGLIHQIQLLQARLRGLEERLNALNPSAIINRGYAIVTNLDGKIIRSIKQVAAGDEIHIKVTDGKIHARTEFSADAE